ncbi:MAG: 3-dehydroquinate synthase II, partial [Candidatus Kariarchaeum pelagius]
MLVELKYYLDDKSLNNWKIEISGIISNSKITSDENLEVIYVNDDNLIEDTIGNIIGEKLIITDVNHMSKVLSKDFNENIKYLYVELDDWKIIPLENLIAKLNELNIELISSVSNLEELILFEKILEIGLNGVIMKINSKEEKHKIEDYILKKSSIKLRMEEFEVTKIQDLGLGDRVCVDTISNLKKGEGMLVGSAASLLVLIEAEVHEVGYVEPR